MGKRKIEINKGAVKDNALKALVKSNLFRHKVYQNKKRKRLLQPQKPPQHPIGISL